MSTTPGSHGTLGQPPFGDTADYRAISSLAVAALLTGAVSATSLIGVPLWIVPLVGILLSWLALVRIDRSAGMLLGRPMAAAGLALSLCFGTAGIATHFYSQRLLAREAQQTANQWFQALAEDQPELAREWTLSLGSRAGFDDPERLKSYYADDPTRRGQLAKFVSQKLIAIMLRLGHRATVNLEETTLIDESSGMIGQRYQATYDDAGHPAHFSVQLLLQQRMLPGGRPWWRVHNWSLVVPEPEGLLD
jgi:hypothetical protein